MARALHLYCCMQSYAEPLLNILDPERRYFAHRLYRDSCLRVPSQSRPGMAFLMKDLTSLGRPLERLLIVDNTPTVSCRHRQPPFQRMPEDNRFACTGLHAKASNRSGRDSFKPA